MMKRINYIIVSAFLIGGLSSCLKDDVVRESEQESTSITAPVVFDKYVSIGNSLTAGYADGGVYKQSQENSFPSILAKSLNTDFVQPMMSDAGSGYMTLAGLTQAGPNIQNVAADPSWVTAKATGGPFNNIGVPGIRAVDMGLPGYGAKNPYMGRLVSNEAIATTKYFDLIEEAVADATFATFWLGNNDVLGYASTGGAYGPNGDAASLPAYRLNGLPELNVFIANMSFMSELLKNKRVIFGNVPPVQAAPFFTTVGPQVYAGVNGNSNYILDQNSADMLNNIYALAGYTSSVSGQPIFSVGQNMPITVVGPAGSKTVRQLKLSGSQVDFVTLPFGAKAAELQTKGLGLINAIDYSNEFNFLKSGAVLNLINQALTAISPIETLLNSLKGISAGGGGAMKIDELVTATIIDQATATALKNGLISLGISSAVVDGSTIDQLIAGIDKAPDAVKPLLLLLLTSQGMDAATANATINSFKFADTKSVLLSGKSSMEAAVVASATAAGINPTDPNAATVASSRLANPIPTNYVLDLDETSLVKAKTLEINTYIASLVQSNPNWLLFDSNSLMNTLTSGVTVDGVTFNASYITGNFFSLDGIHLTPKGYAYVAKLMVQSINTNWNQTLTLPVVSDYRGVKTPAN